MVCVCLFVKREKGERQGCVKGREKETERRVVWLYFRIIHFVCGCIGGQTHLDVDKRCFFFNATVLREDPVDRTQTALQSQGNSTELWSFRSLHYSRLFG